MLVKYPKDLKLPLVSSHRLSQNSNLLRTDMASGRARQRKRFHSVPTTMPATWKLNAAQASMFEGFITHAINDAINWFVMPIRTAQGMVEHEVRFKQSPLESVTFSGSFWQYSANIEIKKRGVIDGLLYECISSLDYQPEMYKDLLLSLEFAVNHNS